VSPARVAESATLWNLVKSRQVIGQLVDCIIQIEVFCVTHQSIEFFFLKSCPQPLHVKLFVMLLLRVDQCARYSINVVFGNLYAKYHVMPTYSPGSPDV
jgi:hypothetical protein